MSITSRLRRIEARAGPIDRCCPQCGRERLTPDARRAAMRAVIADPARRRAADELSALITDLVRAGKLTECPGCREVVDWSGASDADPARLDELATRVQSATPWR